MSDIFRPSRAKVIYATVECHCGCGGTFVRDMANRSRKYAVDCPNQKHRYATYQKRQQKRQERKRQMTAPQGPGRESAMATHRTVRICKLCGNLPERRPREGCPRCKFPHGPPAPIVAHHRTEKDSW